MNETYACLLKLNNRGCQNANYDYVLKGGFKVFVRVLSVMELFLEDSVL